MLKKLIKEELVSLKRLGFKDKYHIQRLQQMADENITFKRWQSSGQMMTLRDYESLYSATIFDKMVSGKHQDIFRYAGGLVIELASEGLYYCKALNKMHPDIVHLEKNLYSHFKDNN